jgi:hypothetical protein
MPNTNSLSCRAVRHFPRLPLHDTPRPVHPLWCQARDTPWVTTMRRQVATATLVGGRGFVRAWRFQPVVTQGCPSGSRAWIGCHRGGDSGLRR